MQKFVVTRYVQGIHHEVPITQEQYRQARQAFSQLNVLALLEERFDAVAGGFLEFEKAMLAEMLEFGYAGFKDGLHQMSVRRKLNRLLMNALSAARGYIDHLPQSCDEVFGIDDGRTASCLNMLSESYDNFLGYRMFEALRNHSQHCGFPIHSVSYTNQSEGVPPYTRARLSLSPIVDIDKLAQNKKFKKSILEEMKHLGQRVDLKSHLREYIRGIARVHYYFRALAKPIADSSDQTFEALANLFALASGSDSPLALHALFLEEGRVIDSVPLATGMKEYFDYLTRNNGFFDQESDFYIASTGRDD
jgi:hypothetical protein